MKKYFFIGMIACSSILFSCQNKQHAVAKAEQQITLSTDYNEVFNVFMKNDDTLYVVNFWATWCKPCVEELPDFMKVNKEFSNNEHFNMVLVSLDKAADIDTKVKDFINQNNITPDVYVLSDNKRMNEWIPKISRHWSGGIPATAIYKNGEQLFFKEGKISYSDLKTTINKFK